MEKRESLYAIPRYVVLVEKDIAKDLEELKEWITIKNRYDCAYDNDLEFLLIEPYKGAQDMDIESILSLTGGLAIHEEFTNGIIVCEDYIEDIGSVFCWDGAGALFLGEMLTEIERMTLIMMHYYHKTKEKPNIDDLYCGLMKQPTTSLPLKSNMNLLFGNDIKFLKYKNVETPLWWPTFMENSGYYLAIVDDKSAIDEVHKLVQDFHVNSPWGDDDDDDDYDGYYNKKENLYF